VLIKSVNPERQAYKRDAEEINIVGRVVCAASGCDDGRASPAREAAQDRNAIRRRRDCRRERGSWYSR
jgi:hypothetical protein